MSVPNILVVEDENLVAMDLQARLEELGFRVSAVVPSGEEAVRTAQESPPDAILMDIKLRGRLDGIEAAQQIRDITDIPIIYLSAYSEETLLQRAKLTGPYAYLIKPFVTRELKMAIDLALARHASEKARKEACERLEQEVTERTAELFHANKALLQYFGETREAKKQVVRHKALLTAINEVFNRVMSCRTEEELGRVFLAFAQELTGSKIGFIGEINEMGRLDTIAVSETSWQACRIPAQDAARKINNMNIQGIWGSVLKTGQSLIANEPATHPEAVGVPPGHPPVTSFLGAPLKEEDGRAMGIIALANKEESYEAADQETVEGLAMALVEALKHWRSEAALRQAELKYRIVAHNTSDWVFWVTPAGKFQYISSACRQITGYGPEDFEADPELMFRVIHPDDRPNFRRHLEEMENIGPAVMEFRIVTADGRIRWISHVCLPIFSPEGQFLGRRGNNRDITERKLAEEALRAEHAFRSAVIAGAAEGICVSHNIPEPPHIKFTVWNERMTEITGYTMEEINRLGWHQTMYPDPELQAQAIERMKRMRDGEDLRGEIWEITRADGEKRLLNKSTSILTDIDGVVHVLALMYDVTEHKEVERTKEKLAVQLFQAQKIEALGTLAGGIAHDFNNILGAMMGFAELSSLAMPEAHEGREYLENLLSAGERAQHLVKQILSFSRQEKTERKLLSLQPVIKETLRFLRASLPATIDIRYHLKAEKALVVADHTQIHQVLLNLATNAAHAMEEKGGMLEISMEELIFPRETISEMSSFEGLQPGPYLELKVSDTGEGMDSQVLERIFEPFFTTKEPGKGTGMGLAMVYGIVKDHEGMILVDSQPGQGSTFRVLLPVIEAQLVEVATELSRPLPKGKGRILFVDDDRDFYLAGQRMLAVLGYEVVAHSSSRRALEEFKSQPRRFDLIISDQTMPGLTGLELVTSCIQVRPDIPIILCTGYNETVTPEKAQAAGIREVVNKPFNLRQIGEIVKKVLKKNKP
jgi:PAS domain S-box-containing protein